ncbi:hypothetical protein [Paenibacillus sp. VMFN-D1]|uniref:hypothetical protein n=1 Tax=Paenibacillus sp. VMFN-D1 TaxID=2135608 RepID=UPI000E226D96|nr:hypothetical protein [Paenibacillus sp. VMFN-D1]RED32291.1 hypothetical protein C7820_5569 [Paenibacillus sp. VMFN-D1]
MSVAEKETVTTVNKAFDYFQKNVVDLDPNVSNSAKSSRNWLVDKLENFPNTVENFPKIYLAENNVQMGSFSRRTKIRPLDDIDFLLVFSAEGSTYDATSNQSYDLDINSPSTAKELYNLCDDGKLNSRKLINKVVSALSNVPQYEKADIHRNQEAATLKLSSYTWNFDIVPAFITAPNVLGNTCYLIPDGSGKWKKTDPRIDANRTTRINTKHGGKVLPLIRLIKYWNARPTMPSISSYLLENIALYYFDNKFFLGTIQGELKNFFLHLEDAIYNMCLDPKGFQGDLNTLDEATKDKISDAASLARMNAEKAIDARDDDDHKKAIEYWGYVFGSNFPEYGQEVD